MGIFGSVWKGVTGPLRGIGNLVQGKFRKAVGAMGDTWKLGGAVLGATGVGLPIAAGVGAIGGAASAWGEEENVLKGALGGAAGGAAGSAANAAFTGSGPLSGIGKLMTGKGGTPIVEEGVKQVVENTGGGVLGYLAENPEVVTDVLGTAADVYGASLQGQAADRQFEWRKEEAARREKRDRLQMLMSLYGSTARF